jgi:PAS domain S-box-containing protein
MARTNENTDRLLELSEVIQDYALGIFDTEVKITPKKDELDGIAQGINILGSHLKNKVTSLNTLKGILDSSPLLTITTDLASNITRINKRGLEILNRNEYDLLGKHLFDTITADGEGFQEVYEKVFNEDNLYNFKVLVKTGQNTLVPCYCSAGVLRNAKNQIEGLIFQCQDISELLDVQEQLENTNKDLEAFSYKVAHDIKAPLCSIEGLLHLIKAEDDPKSIKKYTSLFFDSLEFLQNTVNSLLEEAKFTSLKKEKICHVNFDKLIDLNRKSVNVSLEQNEDDFGKAKFPTGNCLK